MKIVPLHVGDILRDKSSFTCLRNQGLKVELPVICWLIETNEAKVIVDTGTNAPHETAESHVCTRFRALFRAMGILLCKVRKPPWGGLTITEA